jgi:hypothetical protein
VMELKIKYIFLYYRSLWRDKTAICLRTIQLGPYALLRRIRRKPFYSPKKYFPKLKPFL